MKEAAAQTDSATTPAAQPEVESSDRDAGPMASRLIRASAGTGKTFQLSGHYLRLVLAGHPPERILAATFTRKAAGEILGRILLRLARATEGPDEVAQLARELKLPRLTVANCRRALRQLTAQLHRLRVSTLDSFFLQATQALSLDLGLPPNWRILDETDELALREAAIGALLERNDRVAAIELLRNLAHGQAHRSIRRLVSDTVAEMYSLFLASPAKAWQPPERRKGLTSDEFARVIDELSQWCGRNSQRKRLRDAVDKLVEQLRSEDWDVAAKSALLRNTMDGTLTYYGKPIPKELVPHLEKLVEQLRAVIQNQIVLQMEASWQVLNQFHEAFESLKFQRRVLRFDDLSRLLSGLEQSGNWNRLSFRLDHSVDSVLLDEFQDTSLDQWQVLKPFASHACSGAPSRSFLCVGDVKQAIYGWRGGSAALMEALTSELTDLQNEQLKCSYRSSQIVIDVVNQINRNMHLHPHLEHFASAIKCWQEIFPPHETARKDLPGYVTLETTGAAPKADERCKLLVQQAAERVAQLRRECPQHSIAVLVRTNDWVGKVMHALQQRGIPASEEGGNRLTDSAGVQLILSLLTLADHPQDPAARYHVAHSPLAEALGLTDWRDETAAEALGRRVHRSLADVGYGQVVQSWIDQLEPACNAREWRRLNQLAELAYRYQQQVESPRDVGYHQQHAMPLSTAGFIRRVQQQRISDPTEDPVRVMTVHQSKGLQFDTVILPQLDRCFSTSDQSLVTVRSAPTQPIDRIMPWVKQDWRRFLPDSIETLHLQHLREQLGEELCVLYVALTRAIYSLHMIVTPGSCGDDDGDEQGRPAEKKLPQTFAGLIRAALTDGQPLPPSTQVYEHGDPRWFERLPTDGQRADRARPTEIRRVKLRSSGGASDGSVDRAVRPSQLEGGGRVDLRRQLSLAGQAAMERGTLMHAFFEQVEWLDDAVPTAAQLEAIACSLEADAALRRSAIAEFQQMLNRPPIREVLSRSWYQPWRARFGAGDQDSLRLEVRREQPLNVRDGDDWLSGTIDRLVVLYQHGRPVAADILDFKTDSVPTVALRQERIEFYRPQLRAYRRGVSGMLRLDVDRISTRLVFVVDGHVVDLTPQRGGR